MSSTPPERPVTIERLAQAVYPSFAALAGMKLDLFTPLKDGPMAAEALGEAIGVDATRLRPLLYALVTAELLTVEGDLFSNTTEAERFLVRGSRLYVGSRHESWSDFWSATLQTAESIRTGLPQAKHDYSSMSEEELEAFFRGLHSGALGSGRNLARRYDFSSCRALLDVGGGSGGLAIAMTEAYPQLRATVIDLPTVTPITQRFVTAAGADRVEVISGDVLREQPAGLFDAAILSAFIQVLSVDDARRALKNVGGAVRPAGTIYIRGRILDDSRLSPPETVGFNLLFLNIYDAGQAYTDREHREWLAEAGFAEIEKQALEGGFSVMTARKSR